MSQHVHGLAHDAGSDDVLVATHDGLYRLAAGTLTKVGGNVDLMGFATGPDGTFYASGHPGPGTDLPQPLGLVTSTDQGRTWQVASRGGESDFHALAVSAKGVVGFDGTLRSTSDRTTWDTRDLPAPPRTLAAEPSTGRLLATTQEGLLSSNDDGRTWSALEPPGLALLATWADESTIVIVTVDGQVSVSSDAGQTWTKPSPSLGPVEALAAEKAPGASVRIVVAADGKLIETTDAGATIKVLAE